MSRIDVVVRASAVALAVCFHAAPVSDALGQPPTTPELLDPAAVAPDAAAELAAPDLPPVAPPQGPPEPGMFAMMLGRGPQAGPSPRLAGVPNMFGDFFGLGGQVVANESTIGHAVSPLPLAGASRRVKVGEDNKAVPMDRVHFMYNHFHNALDFNASEFPGDPGRKSFSVDRFTLGVEKTFLCGRASVELRMPLAGEADFQRTTFGVSGGSVGNLAVLVKAVVWKTCNASAVIGLGVDLPTGDDVDGYANSLDYTLHNQSVHVLPYVGVTGSPSPCMFYHGFLQVDVPTSGNPIDVTDTFVTDTPQQVALGELNEQTALYVDLGAGYWFYRRRCSRGLTGLAGVVEVHYATTLNDADLLSYTSPNSVTSLSFGNTANRIDQTNVSIGVHSELARCTVFRVGAVFPLNDDEDRSFDSEIQVQAARRF